MEGGLTRGVSIFPAKIKEGTTSIGVDVARPPVALCRVLYGAKPDLGDGLGFVPRPERVDVAVQGLSVAFAQVRSNEVLVVRGQNCKRMGSLIAVVGILRNQVNILCEIGYISVTASEMTSTSSVDLSAHATIDVNAFESIA